MLDFNNVYDDGDFKVRDHCHITGNYRASAQRDCNVNVKLKHNLKNYNPHLHFQELGKFNFKVNACQMDWKITLVLTSMIN